MYSHRFLVHLISWSCERVRLLAVIRLLWEEVSVETQSTNDQHIQWHNFRRSLYFENNQKLHPNVCVAQFWGDNYCSQTIGTKILSQSIWGCLVCEKERVSFDNVYVVWDTRKVLLAKRVLCSHLQRLTHIYCSQCALMYNCTTYVFGVRMLLTT